jgi:hypothetical protein
MLRVTVLARIPYVFDEVVDFIGRKWINLRVVVVVRRSCCRLCIHLWVLVDELWRHFMLTIDWRCGLAVCGFKKPTRKPAEGHLENRNNSLAIGCSQVPILILLNIMVAFSADSCILIKHHF